eukprot:GEMP01001522.1.p1 GENE.GEMP01001522.1~~GEMP01001522.1.p1  ORF type:complete len:1481 (+),score=381.74 GEMP01001522.1:165-4607(+)
MEMAALTATQPLLGSPTAAVQEKSGRKRLNRMSTMERGCKWDEFLAFLRQAADGSLRDLTSGGTVNSDKDVVFTTWQHKLLVDVRAAVDPTRFAEDSKKLDDQIHELRKTLKRKSVALALNVRNADDNYIPNNEDRIDGCNLPIDSDYAGRKKTLYEERTQLVTEVGWMRAVKQRLAAELKRAQQSCKVVCVSEPNFELSKPRPLLGQLGLTTALEKTRTNYNLARQEALCHLHTNIDLQKQCSLIYDRVHSLEAQLDAQVHALRALEARSTLTRRHAESEISSRESTRRHRALASDPAQVAAKEKMKKMWNVIESERALQKRMESSDSYEKISKMLLIHLYNRCAPSEAHAADDNHDLALELQRQVDELERKVSYQNSVHKLMQAKLDSEMAEEIRKVTESILELKNLSDYEMGALETQKTELEEMLHALATDPFSLAANDLNGLYLWIVCDAAIDAPSMSENNLLWELQNALGVDKTLLSLLSVTDERFENVGFGPPTLYSTLPKLDRRCDARPMSRALVLVGATARDFTERLGKVTAFGNSLDNHALFLQLEVSRGAKTVAADMNAAAVVIGHSFDGVTHALISVRYSITPPALLISLSESDTLEEHTLYLLQKDVEDFVNCEWAPRDTWNRRQACANIRVLVDKLLPFLALRTLIGGRCPQRILTAIQTYRRSMRLPPFEEAKVIIGLQPRMPLAVTSSSLQCLLFETLVRVPNAMQTGGGETEHRCDGASVPIVQHVTDGSPSGTPGYGAGIEGFVLVRLGRMDPKTRTFVSPYKLLLQFQSRMPGEQTHVILALRPGSSHFAVHLGPVRVTVSTSFAQVQVEVCMGMTVDCDDKTLPARLNVVGSEYFGWDGVKQERKTLYLDRLMCMADTNHPLVSRSSVHKRDEKPTVASRRTAPACVIAAIESQKMGKKEKRASVPTAKTLLAEERVVTMERDIEEWRMPSTLLWRRAIFLQSTLRIVSCYTNTRIYRLDVYNPLTNANSHCVCCTDPLPHLDTLSIDDNSVHPITFGIVRTALPCLNLGWQPVSASTEDATQVVAMPAVPLHTFDFAGAEWRYCGNGTLCVGGSDVFTIAAPSSGNCTVVAFGWSGHINTITTDTKVHVLVVRRTRKTFIRIEFEGSGSTNADAPPPYKMSIDEDNRDVILDIGDVGKMFALPATMKCKSLRESGTAIGLGTMTKDGFTTSDMQFVLPTMGDILCCFMPRNCTDVKDQCVVAIRQNKDLVWRCGATSWGKKPKKVPLRKALKEFGAKLSASTLSSKKLFHRATRVVRCLENLCDAASRATCLGKLDHPIGTTADSTNPTIISIYRCIQSDNDDSARVREKVVFRMELYNPVDNTRSWVCIPEGYLGDVDIMDRIYCSPGGISLYIDDAPQADRVARVNNVEVRRFTTGMDNVTYTTNLRVLIPPKAFDLHEEDLRRWLLQVEERGDDTEPKTDASVGLHLLEPSWESALISWVANNARLDDEMNLTFEGI